MTSATQGPDIVERQLRTWKHLSHADEVLHIKAADTIASLRAEVERKQKKLTNQRTELRRLNKYLGPYWAGFRKGIDMEAACRLRGIMNAAFGHKVVREAELAAARAEVKGKT